MTSPRWRIQLTEEETLQFIDELQNTKSSWDPWNSRQNSKTLAEKEIALDAVRQKLGHKFSNINDILDTWKHIRANYRAQQRQYEMILSTKPFWYDTMDRFYKQRTEKFQTSDNLQSNRNETLSFETQLAEEDIEKFVKSIASSLKRMSKETAVNMHKDIKFVMNHYEEGNKSLLFPLNEDIPSTSGKVKANEINKKDKDSKADKKEMGVTIYQPRIVAKRKPRRSGYTLKSIEVRPDDGMVIIQKGLFSRPTEVTKPAMHVQYAKKRKPATAEEDGDPLKIEKSDNRLSLSQKKPSTSSNQTSSTSVGQTITNTIIKSEPDLSPGNIELDAVDIQTEAVHVKPEVVDIKFEPIDLEIKDKNIMLDKIKIENQESD